jgi:hypothetical protein
VGQVAFNVVPSGADTFNGNGTTYAINAVGATAYIGATFTSNGSNIWRTAGYN